jgi:subtilisin family serine protease
LKSTDAGFDIHPASSLGRQVPAALAIAAALACGPAWAQGNSPAARAGGENFVAGRILVMPRAGMSDAALDKILGEQGGGKGRRVGRSELRIVDLPPGLERQMVERLRRHPHIKFAEVDEIVQPELVSNDPYLGSQWHLPKIGANAAWDQATGSGITIAILDTGVDGTHPDLTARMVPGWNVYDNNANTADVYGHGTKVAGAAAAAFNNSMGVAGVAGSARIMPIRISSLTGGASFSAMAAGLTWAADNGARVANISYRSAGSAAVNSAASYMKSKGGLVVTSAGNNGVDEGFAQTTAMIPVSATGGSDLKSSWSSWGAYVVLAAPGEGIYTTTNGGGYGSVSGTSFSSPITAGVAALVMSANPKLSAGEVEKHLFSTALDLGAAGRDSYYGHGRVNAAGAVQAALTTVSVPDTAAPSASVTAPLGSSTVSGLVAVSVGAIDNVGVAKVELRVNGGLIGTDSAAPYGFSWDSTQVANGMANLVATAYDAAGNGGTSVTVAVNVANTAGSSATVADTLAPAASIVNPVSGSKVSGNVTIEGLASDNYGVAGIKMVLRINGATVANSSASSSLRYGWQTRKATSGANVIELEARDAAGNTTRTAVTVYK